MGHNVNAENITEEAPKNVDSIKDVYIAVFFDGTNNNMVQKARFHSTNSVCNFTVKKSKKALWKIDDSTPSFDEVTKNINISDYYENGGKKLTEINPDLGFSNIAILHDNCLLVENVKEKEESAKAKIFYVEGSGATDTSHLMPGNPNGLGFGLGNTGVTALVSKAVIYIQRYVESLNVDRDTVKIHFFVYGFSRGSTCGRLFACLINRGEKETIIRESEFSKYYAKSLYKNGRLEFLSDYNKSVDILGIYDTVVSIGFLEQIDGEVHPRLIDLYRSKDDYKGNWHYRNVVEYGLSLNDTASKNIKAICHIGALDEYRENFAFTDIGDATSVPSNSMEFLIPGCHSDVGGGYTSFETEQEIVLSKLRYPNHARQEKTGDGNTKQEKPDDGNKKESSKKPGSVQTSIVFSPQHVNPPEIGLLSIDNLAKAGWIDKNWNKKDKKTTELENKLQPYTLRVRNTESYIKFKRQVKGGYSNIPLEMMIAFTHNENNLLPSSCQNNGFFKSKEKLIKEFQIPTDLKDMANEMISAIGSAKGKRKWIYPSNNYKSLRMKYLHFTCTSDENYHFNAPWARGVGLLEGTLGNLGNTPNFDLEGRLCRIVYHSAGDEKTPGVNKKHGTVKEELHYMYNYTVKDDDIINIKCNISV